MFPRLFSFHQGHYSKQTKNTSTLSTSRISRQNTISIHSAILAPQFSQNYFPPVTNSSLSALIKSRGYSSHVKQPIPAIEQMFYNRLLAIAERYRANTFTLTGIEQNAASDTVKPLKEKFKKLDKEKSGLSMLIAAVGIVAEKYKINIRAIDKQTAGELFYHFSSDGYFFADNGYLLKDNCLYLDRQIIIKHTEADNTKLIGALMCLVGKAFSENASAQQENASQTIELVTLIAKCETYVRTVLIDDYIKAVDGLNIPVNEKVKLYQTIQQNIKEKISSNYSIDELDQIIYDDIHQFNNEIHQPSLAPIMRPVCTNGC